MSAGAHLNDLLDNLALLIAGVTLITFTYRPGSAPDSLARLSVRYAATVALGLYLMLHSVTLAPGLIFDFRAVVIALVARRYGVLPALLVALPLAAYRLFLGGPGAGPALLQLVLVAVLGAWGTGWIQLRTPFQAEPLTRRLWRPVPLFAGANLIYFLAFAAAGRSSVDALPIYVASTLLSALGLFVAFEVKHSRLRTLARTTHLGYLAAVDPLTGCYNRRQFDQDLPGQDGTGSLLLLDIDHFKRVNDTYGHGMGDRVLIALGEALQANVRASDRVYRLGGEEFAVLFSGLYTTRMEEVAERLRQAVEAQVATAVPLAGAGITFSGGLVPVQGDSTHVLNAADQQLYAAKHAGRSRICGTVKAA
ncbi:GGDEF domain-containing protein [Deinococcus ficus]|uniref:GGDEF domain-containing protein n=1 Tax=Deinococcus ficus TaxID=317577 RepID=A0A221T1H3_9DEIO|nr:GGDEF domain-containing protein [Deinococcus ficus]ASN82758.1 GGDEF domain-containing protein [Deinococcus ficus]